MPGNPHPVDQVVVDAVNVSKSAFRSYEKVRAIVLLATAQEVRATDLTGQLLIAVLATGALYKQDTGDTTSSDDGETLIRDANDIAYRIMIRGAQAVRTFAFTGDGIADTFDLATQISGLTAIGAGALVLWIEDGVPQHPGVDFTISGTSIVRDEPPANGAAIFGYFVDSVALAVPADYYIHSQGAAATTWTINHNLGRKPAISLRTVGGAEVDGAITHISDNQATAQFSAALAGTAYCI